MTVQVRSWIRLPSCRAFTGADVGSHWLISWRLLFTVLAPASAHLLVVCSGTWGQFPTRPCSGLLKSFFSLLSLILPPKPQQAAGLLSLLPRLLHGCPHTGPHQLLPLRLVTCLWSQCLPGSVDFGLKGYTNGRAMFLYPLGCTSFAGLPHCFRHPSTAEFCSTVVAN